ncbi:Site-specific DNA recombinase [Pilibacter termitis]|uniref:Site-specific DNA recombinase n=1 Tax=Pilibacter termitis TaxID=263852 RepID=A0A1T4R7Q6_9ENTE|nr:recombinase family protein [Pilibacter termitis]SKA11718.1 Site-specific DNA recombinase [Pilibacter termitis]
MKIIQKIEPTIPKIAKRKRVAAYARVSVEKGRTMHSLSAQVSYYSSYIQKNPEWEYVGVYSEGGISGTTAKKRPDFQRLIEDAKNGKIDIILTKSISRFARNTVDLLETVRELRAIGVGVRFEKENIHSLSGDGELMLSILASFAQEESRSMSNNIKWTIQKRYKQGLPNSKQNLYGYRWQGDELIVVPEEAKIVQEIYANYFKKISAEKTAKMLTNRGIKGYTGGEFKGESVRSILLNITYTGCLLLQKEYVIDPISKKSKRNKGELPQYLVENHHEPIIPMETFQAVQAERARRQAEGSTSNWALNTSCYTSKIKCCYCGKNFRRRTQHSSKGAEPIYKWTCRTKNEKGVKYCNATDIPESVLRPLCAEVVGTASFDEELFLKEIEQILVIERGVLDFKFYGGKVVRKTWQPMIKKDYWTPERKRSWEKRNQRRKSTDWNGRLNEFTGFLVCGRCGANYRIQTTKLCDGARQQKWHCSELASVCKPDGFRHSITDKLLREMVTEVLDLQAFDEKEMDRQLTKISAIDTEVSFHFKDGHIVKRTFKPLKRMSEARKKTQSKKMKEWWRKKHEESNNDTCNNQ